MRTWAMVTLAMIASGCASAASDSAVCEVTDRPATVHAAALAEDGGPASITTGRRLIATLDAACARR